MYVINRVSFLISAHLTNIAPTAVSISGSTSAIPDSPANIDNVADRDVSSICYKRNFSISIVKHSKIYVVHNM